MIQREFRLILTQFCNYRCFFCHCEGAAESFYDSKMACEDYLFLLSTARQLSSGECTSVNPCHTSSTAKDGNSS